MSGNGVILKAAIALLLLWAAVWGISKIVGGMRPTPEKAIAFIQSNDLSEIDDPDQRKQVLADLADMLNGMDGNEVQAFQKQMFDGDESGRRRLFKGLSPEEEWYFMERRIGRAFDQMMQAFNEMDREERKKVVERTLRQMRREDNSDRNALERLEGRDREMVEKITTEGFRAYYEQGNAETKLDLAPVLEEMQRNLGGGRGPR
jgi:hypothetical protein